MWLIAAALFADVAVSVGAVGVPPHPPADHCQAGDRWDALASDGLEYVAADDFAPQSDGSISQVWWSGTYLRDTEACDPGDADAFEVTYYADGGGVPGAVLAGPFRQDDGSLTVSSRVMTAATLLDGLPEYAYHASHAPVAVLAEECYWMEIRNARDDGCTWYWTVARPVDGIAMHERRGGDVPGAYDSLDVLSHDFAFCLDITIGAPAFCGGPTPANDACEGRFTISDGAHPITTIAATSTGNGLYDYNYYVCCCDSFLDDNAVHRDVWFEYVPSCTGMLWLDLCDADFDSKILVYRDYSCPGYGNTPHACNDDGCGHEPSELSGFCFRDPDRALVPCWDDTCLGRVRAIDPECYNGRFLIWPWPPHCDAIAAAVCRKPVGVQSDLVARVEAGVPYLIRVGGYLSDDGRSPQDDAGCLGRICQNDPRCCTEGWAWYCEDLATDLCRGDAGTGTLNVELVAPPLVETNLRHFHEFLDCFSGPCEEPPCDPPIYPQPCCLVQDFNNDGDVDVDDYALLHAALSGP